MKYSHQNYTDYLTNGNPDSYFLSYFQLTKKKLNLFSLDINKFTGPYIIPSKVIRMLKSDIFEQLADLLSFSFTKTLSQLF